MKANLEEKKRVFVAIPVLDEYDYLPATLDSVFSQNVDCHVFICVNQPEEWWKNPNLVHVCHANAKTLDFLQKNKYKNLEIIDKSTLGKGWKGKKQGVGMARKTLFEKILQIADNQDIIISLDADTILENGYFKAVQDVFKQKKNIALAAPYYHHLSGNENQDRAMLRYEIYLRTYFINLMNICSPYSFSALGSVIACKVEACRAVGGFDSQMSGEDFYFLQKMRKYGKIALFCEKKVFPANRFSKRVPFGTGPAIEKGIEGDFSAYPIYDISSFDEIEKTYKTINQLFEKNIQTPFFSFLQKQFKEMDFLQPLRKNYKTRSLFAKAFHQKVDALREFQFLRSRQQSLLLTDEMALENIFLRLFPEKVEEFFRQKQPFSFKKTSIEDINSLRNFLAEQEMKFRYNFDNQRYDNF